MMQLTSQNRFTRNLLGSYKMTNGSRVRKLFIESAIDPGGIIAVAWFKIYTVIYVLERLLIVKWFLLVYVVCIVL